MDDEHQPTRRIELTMHRPRLALYVGIKPTLVIGGRGQPTQWGPGTWQVPSDRTATIGVYLFTRVWRFGQAEIALAPEDDGVLEYRAPTLPFLRGRLVHRSAASGA
ncbi:hypothetical protein [Microbacterium sp. MYb62]|uniref:hypothetical protein n=1 Tax=Microbacterium sp. MYb62 TaxID=1848690 RepID=UPI000CFE0BE6|nr:hypothetical protein [Microbacterium sp. MYb62]PRB17232.1 hypothetical protein CQ042_05355 [Microbacterium sp. MYb62]